MITLFTIAIILSGGDIRVFILISLIYDFCFIAKSKGWIRKLLELCKIKGE